MVVGLFSTKLAAARNGDGHGRILTDGGAGCREVINVSGRVLGRRRGLASRAM